MALYDLLVNKNFQNSGVKLLVLGIQSDGSDLSGQALEQELAKDIDKIRFSRNVSLYENTETGAIDDYLKNAEKFAFSDIRAAKVVVQTTKLEGITKSYLDDFINN